MLPIREYTLADWQRLRPLTHFLKQRRYRKITRHHVGLPARAGDLEAARRAIHGQRALITVGFEDPQAIEWQSELIRRHVDGVYVVADNSVTDAGAASIARVCADRGVPYVRLPAIAWRRGVSSRSHGLALNWVWTNIILPGEPSAFGFLDDDIFPTATDDPFAPLARQPYYGFIREWGARWFLWAGFCFFRFEAVKGLPLDFGEDRFKGLDTGGGNWDVLYSRARRDELAVPDSRHFPFREGETGKGTDLQWVGTWLHEIGFESKGTMSEKRRVVAGMIGMSPENADAR